MTDHSLKDKISATADQARDTAASALDTALGAGRAARDEVAALATETFKGVRDVASGRAEGAREAVADMGDRLARSLEDQAPGTGGLQDRLMNGVASGLGDVSDGLRNRSVRELYEGVQDYAKQNPGTVALGAAVAGFALARMLRSSTLALSAQERAAEATDRVYREAARRTVDTMGQAGGGHGERRS